MIRESLIPLVILALGVALAYSIGYPWPWSRALDRRAFGNPSTVRGGDDSSFWRPAQAVFDEPRYWFIRFQIHPEMGRVRETWVCAGNPVAALQVISRAIGGQFVVLVDAPISRLTMPRLDVMVFGEAPADAAARADYQRRCARVNARLALSEIQRAGLPPCRNTPPAQTAGLR